MDLNHRLDGPEGAPLLVLGASLGTSLELWEPQLAALTRSWRVLRYDYPGHGGSPAHPEPFTLDDLAAAVLELTGGERFTVGGVSLGGAVALTLALAVPDRVDGLIMVCSGPRFGEPAAWHERAAQVRAQGMPHLVPTLLERWFVDRSAVPVARVEEMLLSVDPASYAACCGALAGYDLSGRLGEVAVPTLVIGAEGDPVSPPDQVRALAEAIPGARLAIVPGAAHLANYERPGAVLTHLEGFLKDGRGLRVRREVLGEAHVARANAAATDFTADFQELITRYAWGEIWTRPGLDRRTRSCITLTALVAGGHLEELALHVRAARRIGLTPEEIKEVLLQTAIYCGVPAANAAFAVAQRVLAEPEERS